MRKKILVADRDASLKDIFRVTFTDDKYEILYGPTARDVERLAADERPDIYIVNVSLQKGSGIEVYERLKSQGLLAQARFFFLKNEDDMTDVPDTQAEGVIDKPINFFKLHERVDRDDDIIELTEVVEEPQDAVARRKAILEEELKRAAMRVETREPPIVRGFVEEVKKEVKEVPKVQEKKGEDWLEAMSEKVTSKAPVTSGEGGMPPLTEELKKVLGQAIGEAAIKVTDDIAAVVSRYVEAYTRQTLYEVAERVIREEIDKLLKESSG
jgi:response regulator RpfG family c-di-GMP phosphodiesterase